MTRPMPGPPEKYQLLGPMVIVWEGGDGYYYHPSLMDDKRLTDAECAAEYWRARWETEANHYDRPILAPASEWADWEAMTRRAATWERLATSPHAFKETHNDRP